MKKTYYIKTKILLLFALVPIFFGCDKDDENSDDNEPIDSEVVTVAERIEFSRDNIIPNDLQLLSLSGSTDVNSDETIPLPNTSDGIEFLKDGQNNLIFLKRNLPNQENTIINSRSSVLYFATINTLFENSSNSQKIAYINLIVNNPLFTEAINILNSQVNINLFASQFINKVNELISEVFTIESIAPNTFQLGSIDYSINSTTVSVNNPTNNHIGLGIYVDGISQGVQVIDAGESLNYTLQDVSADYDFNLMSGEDVATDIFGNNQLEEIEAFDADMRDFLESSCYALIGFAIPEDCFGQIFNSVYGNVEFALEYEQSESTLQAVSQALSLFFIQFSGAIQSSEACVESINFGSISEIVGYLEDILEALDAGEFLADIAVTIQDYSIYENQYEICLETDGTGVEICSEEVLITDYNFISTRFTTSSTLRNYSFSSNGLHLYMIIDSQIQHFILPAPYDLSNIGTPDETLILDSSQGGSSVAEDAVVSQDGMTLYVQADRPGNFNDDYLQQYSLSNAFSINNVSYIDRTEINYKYNKLKISNDDSKLYIAYHDFFSTIFREIREFEFTTPNDITSIMQTNSTPQIYDNGQSAGVFYDVLDDLSAIYVTDDLATGQTKKFIMNTAGDISTIDSNQAQSLINLGESERVVKVVGNEERFFTLGFENGNFVIKEYERN